MQSSLEETYDIVVVGAGLAGLALVQALAHTRFRILLLEKRAWTLPAQVSLDARNIALSLESQRLFSTWGLWAKMVPWSAAIRHVHVSDRGGFGACRLAAETEGLQALGYVVPLPAIGQALASQLPANTTFLDQTKVTALSQTPMEATLVLEQAAKSYSVKAKLVVVADGTDSSMAKQLQVDQQEKDYGQSAIVTQMSASLPATDIAYERFSPEGPIAVLPLKNRDYGIVWVVSHEEALRLQALPESAFQAAFQAAFGYRVGCFSSVKARSIFPLKLQIATTAAQGRVLLLGNSAHSLHPVAGQGFNLSLRDVAILAEILAASAGLEAAPVLLDTYQRLRKEDQARTIRITDSFVRVFSSQQPLHRLARRMGLRMFERAPRLKTKLNNTMMGLVYPHYEAPQAVIKEEAL